MFKLSFFDNFKTAIQYREAARRLGFKQIFLGEREASYVVAVKIV